MNTKSLMRFLPMASLSGFAVLAPLCTQAGNIDVPDLVEGFASLSTAETNNCCLANDNYFVGSEPEADHWSESSETTERGLSMPRRWLQSTTVAVGRLPSAVASPRQSRSDPGTPKLLL
jgi:hypothetical protein